MRALRVRTVGRRDRPRLAVFRSGKNISCQIIDDTAGRTLVACSTLEETLGASLKGLKKAEKAAKVGEEVARRAKGMGISKVVFDRRWYRFHGRVKALAEAARKGGLQF